MKGPGLEPSRDSLPGYLAELVAPEVRDALDHPLRRDLLRALLAAGRPLRLVDLQAIQDGPEASLAQLQYHTGVLELAELVRSSGLLTEPATGGIAMEPSPVAGEEGVQRVLRLMRPYDLEQKRSPSRRSSRLLSMFRVPGPAITLKMGQTFQPRKGRG